MGSIVLTREITGKLDYIFQSDLFYQDGKSGDADEDAASFNQYLIYQMNCCWSAGVRFETPTTTVDDGEQ